MERMEEIRQQLVESGVIGRVVDDFNPHLELIVCYGDKRVNLGDEVTLAEVQHHPTNLECDGDAFDPELEEIFANPELELVAMVMTEADAPGGEYLHWLTVRFLATERAEGFPQMELAAFEPLRSGAHMIVFTLFKAHGLQSNARPNSRENFTTRSFAHTNALGSPLGACFFTIKYENEGNDSSTCSSAGSSRKRRENGSTSNTCSSDGSCSKRQENGSTRDPKEIPESTSRRRRISISLGPALSSINEGENRKKD